jgi:hypothetical protein
VLLGVLALGLLAALVRADVPPLGALRSPQPVTEPLRLKGRVEIEVVPEGEAIQLFVPRSMLAPLARQQTPEPPAPR